MNIRKLVVLFLKVRSLLQTLTRKHNLLCVVVAACNPTTKEDEAGRSQIYGQPGLHSVSKNKG
jgi:hypothetical protein